MAGLKFTIEADTKKLIKLREELTNLKQTLSSLDGGDGKLSERIKDLENQYEKLSSRIEAMHKELSDVTASEKVVNITRKIREQTESASETMKLCTDSIGGMKEQVRQLTKDYAAMSAEQRNSSDGKALASNIASLNASIKSESDNLRVLQREYLNTSRMQEMQEGSLTALRAELSNLNHTYDTMSRTMRQGDAGKAVLSSIQTVTTELNEAEQASMRFQRNVGNYASGFNGINMSVQQIARELPSLSGGLGMFILAISNNLPMLQDEISRARKEFAELKAEGQSATPVWKQLVSSIFSWQTALMAGIAVITIYRNEIQKWIKSLSSASREEETAEAATRQRQKNFDSYTADFGRNMASQISSYTKLRKEYSSLGNDMKAKKKFIIDNSSAFENLGLKVTDVNDAESVLINNTQRMVAALSARAKAMASEKVATDLYEQYYKNSISYSRQEQRLKQKNAGIKKSYAETTKTMGGSVQYGEQPVFGRTSNQQLNKDAAKSNIRELDRQENELEKNHKASQQRILDQANSMMKFSAESMKAASNLMGDFAYNKKTSKTPKTPKTKTAPYFDEYKQTQSITDINNDLTETVRKQVEERQQMEIDLMQEGTQKKLALIRLDYQKRTAEIEKDESEYLKKLQKVEYEQWQEENPDYKKKKLTFTNKIIALTPEQSKPFADNISSATSMMEQETKAAYDALFEQYQSYEQRRADVFKKYAQDRVDVNSSGRSEVDKKSAISEIDRKQQEALKTINDEEVSSMQKDNGFIVSLFKDTADQSTKEIEKIMSKTKLLIDYLSSEKNDYGDAIIKDKKGRTRITVKKQNVMDLGFTDEQVKALSKSPEQIKAITEAYNKLKESANKSNPFKQLYNSIKDLFDNGSQGDTLEKKFKKVGESASASADVIGKFAGQLSDMFEAAGNNSMAQTMDDIQTVASSVSNIANGFAQGGLVGGIAAVGSEAISWATKAFTAESRHKAALQAIMNDVIAQQRTYNLLLMQQSLEYEKGTTMFGTDLYGKAENSVNVYRQSVNSLADELKKINDIEIIAGHKKTGLFGWGKGRDLYSDILSVYPELIDASGEFNSSLAETVISTRKMSEQDKAALQYLIDLSKEAKDSLDELNSYFQDIFGDLGNSISDAMADAAMNGTDAFSTMCDSVSNMLEKLSKNMIYSITIAPIIEKAQKQMLSVAQDAGLADDEKFANYASILNALTDEALQQQGNYNKLIDKYKAIAASKNINIYDNTNSTKASSATTVNVSQDSVDEANGRMTAIEEILVQIEHDVLSLTGDELEKSFANISFANLDIPSMDILHNDLSDIVEKIALISDRETEIKYVLDEILDFAATSTMYANSIDENSEKTRKDLNTSLHVIQDIQRKTQTL